jgi:hypothetical protein
MATSAGIAVVTSLAVSSSNKYWYDIYHKYFTFGSEYTHRIDQILSDPNHGKMGPFIVIAPGKHIPGPGYHRYYINRRRIYKSMEDHQHYVGLEKIRMEDQDQYYYLAWISPLKFGVEALQDLERKIMNSDDQYVQTISIDVIDDHPQLTGMTKICHSPHPHQEVIINEILRYWTIDHDYNAKILIMGPSGCGKSYIGLLLKKIIGGHIRLYDDFDPTIANLNVNQLILNYASMDTPVILVINEINLLYDRVITSCSSKIRPLPRFINLLDTIASTPHVIIIYTSSRSDLFSIEAYQSFLRPGRIDLISTMTAKISEVKEHE